MFIAGSSRERVSSIIGVSVVTEDAQSHFSRIQEERSYHLRRYELASEAAEEYSSSETRRFAADTQQSLETFDPSSVLRKRWLSLGRVRIPLRSR